jgi:hypothetical protein
VEDYLAGHYLEKTRCGVWSTCTRKSLRTVLAVKDAGWMLVETAGAFARLPVTSKDDDYGKEDTRRSVTEKKGWYLALIHFLFSELRY